MSAIFGETLTFADVDGSTVELRAFGDEFYARYETSGGHTVVFDTDLGTLLLRHAGPRPVYVQRRPRSQGAAAGAQAPFEGVRAQVASGLESPDLLIPDNKAEGIASAIGIGEAGAVRSVRVTVDISHTYIGVLEVELETPSGRTAMLHDNASGSQDDIQTTYGPGVTASLAFLVGESIAGDWVLHVRD